MPLALTRLKAPDTGAPGMARVTLVSLAALVASGTPPTWKAVTRLKFVPVTIRLPPTATFAAETAVTAGITTGLPEVVVTAVSPPPPPPPQADRPSMTNNATSKWFFTAGILADAARGREGGERNVTYG